MPQLRIYNENSSVVIHDLQENVINTFSRGTIDFVFDPDTGIYSFYINAASGKKLLFQNYVVTIRAYLDDFEKRNGDTFSDDNDLLFYLSSVLDEKPQIESDGYIDSNNRLAGVNRSIWNNDFQANTRDTFYATLGARLQANQFYKIEKRAASFFSNSNVNYQWLLCLNPVVQGNVVWQPLSNSFLEYARTDTTNTILTEADLGTILESGYGSDNRKNRIKFDNRVALGGSINAQTDEIWLVVSGFINGMDMFSQLTLNEFV